MGESADGLTAAGEFRRHDRDLRRMGLLARKLGMKIRGVEMCTGSSVPARNARKEGSHVVEATHEIAGGGRSTARVYAPGRYTRCRSERLPQRCGCRCCSGTRGRSSCRVGRGGWLRRGTSHREEKATTAATTTTAGPTETATAAGTATTTNVAGLSTRLRIACHERGAQKEIGGMMVKTAVAAS